MGHILIQLLIKQFVCGGRVGGGGCDDGEAMSLLELPTRMDNSKADVRSKTNILLGLAYKSCNPGAH